MTDIALFDGIRVATDEARVHALGSAALFGYHVFERMRGFYDKKGQLHIRALKQHLARAKRGSECLFGQPRSNELLALWRQWVIEAVVASKLSEPYIHLGYGALANPHGAMLQSGANELQTFIYVNEAPPLYGERVSLWSETKWPRPSGPLTPCKVSGLYAELLFFKNRARERQAWQPDQAKGVAECLLFDRDAFSFDPDAAGVGTLLDPNAFVAEFGCSNAISVCDENLHLPHGRILYFKGISVQILEALFRVMYPERAVKRDLHRDDLLQGGGAIGTATRDLIPVADVNGVPAATNATFRELAGAYHDLCRGNSPYKQLQEQWAPITE